MNVEAVREEQGRAFRDVRLQLAIERLLRHVRNEHGHELRAFDRGRRLGDFQAVLLRLAPTIAFANADHDVVTAVAQIERVRAALASIAEHRDARSAQGLLIDVFV